MFNKQNYTPMLFLAALWPGGMSVTFFMYLMFIIPRDKEKFVIPTFNSLRMIWDKWEIFFQFIIIIASIWILFFAFKHLQMLFWNIKKYLEFKKSNEFNKLKNSISEITIIAVPLTFAMTVNVFFILWAIFIPNLWNIVEYLFPITLISYSIIWFFALKIFSEYFIKLVLKSWNADFLNNNSLSQAISVFAFIMVWVWFSASAAMSSEKLTIFLWLIWSIFFVTIAVFFMILKIIFWFKAIFEHWIDKKSSPSMWIIIPILTLLWITIIRQTHWLHEFWWHFSNSTYLILTTAIISIQIIFWYLWYKIMKSNNYFDDYIYWKEKDAGSYSLICPWVALVVFSFFFIHNWLVNTWILTKFSITYFIIINIVIFLQIKTIYIMNKLNSKFF